MSQVFQNLLDGLHDFVVIGFALCVVAALGITGLIALVMWLI